MNRTTDQALLRDYASSRCEAAFAELLRRHLDFVYAVALRVTANRALAEDVSQSVFIALAKNARHLSSRASLEGWLHQTARNQACAAVRSEVRRRSRETEAARMQIHSDQSEDRRWEEVIPHIDDALEKLGESDRDMILLRYFKRYTVRDIAARLSISEAAAQKRVQRAVDRLQASLSNAGYAIPSAALAGLLLQNSIQAAPSGLAASIASAVVVGVAGAGLTASSIPIITFMASAKIKIAVVGLTVAGVVGTAIIKNRIEHRLEAPIVLPPKDVVESEPSSNMISRLPQIADTPPAPALLNPHPSQVLDRNILRALAASDTSVLQIPQEKLDQFLARNKTNASSLLAAYNATWNVDYLRRAATSFPNEPAVVLAAVARNAFPENNREWMDQLKKIDPQNSLPDYLSALGHLRAGAPGEALKDLAAAAKKPLYEDYMIDTLQSLEDIHLSNGRSSAEAKAIAMHGLLMPQVPEMGDLTRELVGLQNSYLEAGDSASAVEIARLGVSMSDRLRYGEGAKSLLGEVVGLVMEQRLVKNLDPNGSYNFLREPVSSIINNFPVREAAFKQTGDTFSDWFVNAEYSDVVSYFDRLKLYGESAAIGWLTNRANGGRF